MVLHKVCDQKKLQKKSRTQISFGDEHRALPSYESSSTFLSRALPSYESSSDELSHEESVPI
jgi:hypothetical protein